MLAQLNIIREKLRFEELLFSGLIVAKTQILITCRFWGKIAKLIIVGTTIKRLNDQKTTGYLQPVGRK